MNPVCPDCIKAKNWCRKHYDERQTQLCDRLHEFIRSIAVLSAEAQKMSAGEDRLSDQLDLIRTDVEEAISIHNDILMDKL